MKPISSMRSASSSVSTSIADRSTVRRSHVIDETAGRRDNDVCSAAQRLHLRPMPTPPKIAVDAQVRRSAGVRSTAPDAPARQALASARARGRAASRVRRRLVEERRSIIGRPNAAVLPVPVWAGPAGRRRSTREELPEFERGWGSRSRVAPAGAQTAGLSPNAENMVVVVFE